MLAQEQGQQAMDALIGDKENPFVVFSLTTCGFCWAARRMFDSLGIPYVAVDLDSMPYLENGLGRQIRSALLEKTGSSTVPQIFVGGDFVGGCTEAFAANDSGELQELLDKHQVPYNNG